MATATVTLGLNSGPLMAGLNAAQARIRSFGAATTGLFRSVGTGLLAGGVAGLATALSGRQFVSGIANSIKLGSELHNLSKSSGAAVGELAKLRGVFLENDKSAEEMGGALARMNKFIAATDDASSPAAATLAELNIPLEKLRSLKTAGQFQEIAKGIMAIDNPANRAAAAMEIFGRSGAELIPVFDDIKSMDLSRLTAFASLMEKNAKRMDDLGDAFDRAKRKREEFFAGVTTELIGSLSGGVEKIEGADAVGAGQKVGKALVDGFNTGWDRLKKMIESDIGTINAIGRLFGKGPIKSPFGPKPAVAPTGMAEEAPVEVSGGDPWGAFRKFKSFTEPMNFIGDKGWGGTNAMTTSQWIDRFGEVGKGGSPLPAMGTSGALSVGGGGQMNEAYGWKSIFAKDDPRWRGPKGETKEQADSVVNEIKELRSDIKQLWK